MYVPAVERELPAIVGLFFVGRDITWADYFISRRLNILYVALFTIATATAVIGLIRDRNNSIAFIGCAASFLLLVVASFIIVAAWFAMAVTM